MLKQLLASPSITLTVERNVLNQLDEWNVVLDFADEPARIIDGLGVWPFQSVRYLVLVAATRTDVMGSQSDDHFDGSEFSRAKKTFLCTFKTVFKKVPNTQQCSERPLRSSGCWSGFRRTWQRRRSRNSLPDKPWREIRWESFLGHQRSSPHGWTFAIQCDILFQIHFCLD